MSNLTGLDIAQVRNWANQSRQTQQQLESILQNLMNAGKALEWRGTDAVRFKEERMGTLQQATRQVSELLIELGQVADRHAQEQEAAQS